MVNKRWSTDEEYDLIDFFSSHLEQYTKGVKTKFYESAAAALPQKSATQVKSKCIELESSYKTYKAKLSRSGFVVNATDPSSIKCNAQTPICALQLLTVYLYLPPEMQSKKCKYFYEMDEIFGSRHNILPPVVLEPGTTVRNGRVLARSHASRTPMITSTNNTPAASFESVSTSALATTAMSFLAPMPVGHVGGVGTGASLNGRVGGDVAGEVGEGDRVGGAAHGGAASGVGANDGVCHRVGGAANGDAGLGGVGAVVGSEATGGVGAGIDGGDGGEAWVGDGTTTLTENPTTTTTQAAAPNMSGPALKMGVSPLPMNLKLAGSMGLQTTVAPMSASGYFQNSNSCTSLEALSGNKREHEEPKGSPVAKLLSRLRCERDETRAARHREEMLMRREELALKQQQFEAYKTELSLEQLKMERMFTLMTQKMELQVKEKEVELIKLRGSDKKTE